MDLNTIEAIVQPRERAAIPACLPGDAFLAGGTWLFSEPQTGLKRLVDLSALGWKPLSVSEDGLTIAATCTLAELEAFEAPAGWAAAPLIGQCCGALLGSFKIRLIATVGGNLCLALAASPMAALLVALEATCIIWTSDCGERALRADRFITGANCNALEPGEILRCLHVPEAALRRPTAFRKMSLTPDGRSAALVVGTLGSGGVVLTITASVARPVQLILPAKPTAKNLADRVDAAIPVWYDDLHGAPHWRRKITHIMAAEICDELFGP